MLEVLREGWLTKSPPDWKFWNSKWKPRYFVLVADHSAGECSLKYYLDEEKTKLRGSINLDECVQVDANLTFDYKNRIRYQWIFDIRVPKRMYYLVAGSEEDMNAWVNDLCCVCNLQRDQEPDYEDSMIGNKELLGLDPSRRLKRHGRPVQMGQKVPADWLNGDGKAAESEEAPPRNDAGASRLLQGYIPLQDCISGPPRPKNRQRSANASEAPPSHPPPPLPADFCLKSTAGNGQEETKDFEKPPPPRPPKRTLQPADNVYENESTNETTIPATTPFYDSPLSSACSLFSSLPRPVKLKTADCQAAAGSAFGTMPRLPRRSNPSADAQLSSLSDLSISSGGTASSLNNNTVATSPNSDYYSYGPRSQPTDASIVCQAGARPTPPEVRRELKPGRLNSRRPPVQTVPSSRDVQPHLPYRLSKEPSKVVAGVKLHSEGPSLDLSRQISFSKKRPAMQETSSRLVIKPTYATVVKVPALRDYSATHYNSASETEAEDLLPTDGSGQQQMQYVEVSKTEDVSRSASPLPATAQANGGGTKKTSYVVISQEKTQALLKTKSEQDHMYKTGTLERNKLAGVLATPAKKA